MVYKILNKLHNLRLSEQLAEGLFKGSYDPEESGGCVIMDTFTFSGDDIENVGFVNGEPKTASEYHFGDNRGVLATSILEGLITGETNVVIVEIPSETEGKALEMVGVLRAYCCLSGARFYEYSHKEWLDLIKGKDEKIPDSEEEMIAWKISKGAYYRNPKGDVDPKYADAILLGIAHVFTKKGFSPEMCYFDDENDEYGYGERDYEYDDLEWIYRDANPEPYEEEEGDEEITSEGVNLEVFEKADEAIDESIFIY
ncbi:MAG: hypothetical protein IJ796_09240 [Lachnospiraceae bacterium]|nr:hypothetical protein [Lachnospiraceae bacterium]